VLSEHVSRYGEATRERLAMITQALIARGTPVPLAETKAIAIIQGQVLRQAAMLSYEHLFLMFGLGMVMTLPLLLLMRRGKASAGGGMAH